MPLADRGSVRASATSKRSSLLGALAWWWTRAIRRARARPQLRTRRRAARAHRGVRRDRRSSRSSCCGGWNYRRATVVGARRLRARRASPTRRSRAFSERIVDTLNATSRAPRTPRRLDRAKLRARVRAARRAAGRRLGRRRHRAQDDARSTRTTRRRGSAASTRRSRSRRCSTRRSCRSKSPRALAHEWAHVGGFTDEGDANYIGTLACLRSADPLIRYSGAFWTYGDLPEAQRRRLRLDPRVIADFQASRERFLRHYKPQLFAFQWRVLRQVPAQQRRAAAASRPTASSCKLLVGTRLDAAACRRVARRALREARVSAGARFRVVIACSVAASRPSARRPRSSPSYGCGVFGKSVPKHDLASRRARRPRARRRRRIGESERERHRRVEKEPRLACHAASR